MQNLSIVVASALVVVTTLANAGAQRGSQTTPAAAPPGDVVVGSGNYSPIVQNLDNAIEFYGGLLGLTVPPAQAPGPRPFSADPAIRNMFGIPSAQLRWVVARVPGPNLGVEMVEAKDIDRKAVNPRPQDPGSTTLVVLVRDIDKAFAPFKSAGVPVVTPGGAPMTFGANSARGVIVRDPDGHFVELLQPSPLPDTNAPPESNIIDARLRITVADTDKTMQVYRDRFQFQPQIGSFGTIPLLDLMGLKGSQIRLTTAQVPGSALRMEFVEIKGVERSPVRPRIQDPGATRLQIRVKDLDATISKLKTSGSTVVSAGGVPATLQGGVRAAIMPDPDGLYFVLIQAAPPRSDAGR
jgi:predicted enzyme related to lactoylglutathione lyase/catechol 2,3-dioxygenase-like lactoylglutathione lyase family enzyme